MNLTKLQKFCSLQTRDRLQDALLVAEFQMILKSYQVVTVRHQVFLTQLYGSVRYSAGFWIDQSDRLHRPKTQGVATATGHLFDWQTAFKILCVFEAMQRHLLSRHKS